MLWVVTGIVLLVGSLAGSISWPLGISGAALVILGFVATAQPAKKRTQLQHN